MNAIYNIIRYNIFVRCCTFSFLLIEMQDSNWKDATKKIEDIQKSACEITSILSEGKATMSVTQQLKLLHQKIEDMSTTFTFSPQQAGMLREISNTTLSQINQIPAGVKEVLASDFEKLESCVEEMRHAHDQSHNEIVIKLERLMSLHGVDDLKQREEMLNPLIKVQGEVEVTDQIVGKGGFGEVVIGCYQGTEMAVKIVKHSNLEKQKLALVNEDLLMNLCKHPSILSVYGIAHMDQKTRIVMELATRGNLASLLFDKEHFPLIPLSVSVWWMTDAARAAAHIHSVGVIHRDIEPENMLIKHDLRLALCDFGIAKEKKNSTLGTLSKISGTPNYMAPEVKMSFGANHRSDAYGLGATAYAILQRLPPLLGRNLKQLAQEMVHDIPSEVRDNFHHFFSEILEQDINKKISAKDAHYHLLAIGEILGGDPRGASALGHVDKELVQEIDSTASMLFQQSLSVAVGKKDDSSASPSKSKSRSEEDLERWIDWFLEADIAYAFAQEYAAQLMKMGIPSVRRFGLAIKMEGIEAFKFSKFDAVVIMDALKEQGCI